MRASELPEVFGIVRTQSSSGPCLQLCTTDYVRRNSRYGEGLVDYHIIQNARQRYIENSDLTFEVTRNNLERALQCIRYKHPHTGQVQEVYCWVLPLRMMRNDRPIPIVDFQYRSWLPSDYDPLPIQFNHQVLRRIVEDLQQEKLREIQQLEDTEATDHSSVYGPIPNERFYRSPYYSETNIYGIRTPVRIRSPSPPPIQVSELPVAPTPVVERIVIQRRGQALPKSIGDILLANARQGEESCPITASPFKECEKICVTSCFHIFDSESLARWQTDHTSCPVCRTTIENVVCE